MDAFENMFYTELKPSFRPNHDLNRNPYGHQQTINNNFHFGGFNKPYQHHQPAYQVQPIYQNQPPYQSHFYQPKPTPPKPYQPYPSYQQNQFNSNPQSYHTTNYQNQQFTQPKNSDQIPENLRCHANNRYRRQARIIGGTKVRITRIIQSLKIFCFIKYYLYKGYPKKANTKAWAWFIELEVNGFQCGGTIIGQRWILTARDPRNLN